MTTFTNQSALSHLRLTRAESCNRCNLCAKRRKVVFGSGFSEANLMIVGDAPGEEDDASGRPFSGRPGQMLAGLLKKAEIDYESAYLTTTVKCLPPSNRTPSPIEVAACSPFLHTQIAILRPKVILALGVSAGVALTSADADATMGHLRSTEHRAHGLHRPRQHHRVRCRGHHHQVRAGCAIPARPGDGERERLPEFNRGDVGVVRAGTFETGSTVARASGHTARARTDSRRPPPCGVCTS